MVNSIPSRMLVPSVGLLKAFYHPATVSTPCRALSAARQRVTLLRTQRFYSSERLPIHRNTPNLTADPAVQPEAGEGQTPPPPPPPPKSPRSLRPYFWSAFFLLLGLNAGNLVRFTIAPPPPIVPGSPDDAIMSASIRAQSEKISLVQQLGGDPAWKSWDAYSNFTEEEKKNRITSGPLGGSKGLGGFQRIFYNETTGEVVNIVWFGGSLTGWPGVTHGGLIATVMDETLGRAAIKRFSAGSGTSL
jgi:hypothetical protein